MQTLKDAAEALELAGQVIVDSPEVTSPTEAILSAQALSTFALAEAQHTANLIAWCKHTDSVYLRREIQKRLGL